MRIAYLDCFAGISGDMLLGALADAGVPHEVLSEATAALRLGARLEFETVDRSGISATKVHVLEGDRLADAPAYSSHAHGHDHAAKPAGQDLFQSADTEPLPLPDAPQPIEALPAEVGSPSGRRQERPQPFSPFDHQRPFDHQSQDEPEPLTAMPETQHSHRLPDDAPHEHTHTHESSDHSHTHSKAELHPHVHVHTHGAGESTHNHGHAHTHGRSLSTIRELISNAELADSVKQFALKAFQLLGESEARIHNVPVETIHFHEVGAVDAIVDIVAGSAGLVYLGVDRWFCSPLNVGGGTVQCAHGSFPVPAPATADLLRGVPTYADSMRMELVTPTGAALIRALAPDFTQQPGMRVEAIGYGAGTRDPEGFPNVLRLQVGESVEALSPAGQLLNDTTVHPHAELTAGLSYQNVVVLETALDDLSPQILAHVAEKALAEGALDVMLTPVIMKKGRPGTLLTLLADPEDHARFEQMLLSETSTLGVRTRHERRACLAREHVTVTTAYGEIRMKLGKMGAETLNAQPEFEDCRTAAQQHGISVKHVQQTAIAVFHRSPIT